MTTEVGPNPAEFRANLRNKLASMPPVGPQGRELKAEAPSTESAEPVAVAALAVPAVAPRMKPNPSQGSSSQRVAAPAKASANPLEAIRAKAAGQAPLDHDPTL